ncbi:MAG: helix-turn-helix domain-containing protein [Balneolaceae bacterium]|nr:helix-turn-helix domain-containing protein [Balneolaceae bacterium]
MPSLGKDLETIRKHLGLTIQDIQNATKLPLNTLRSIENDDIFEQQEENITYVRSFIRTYARNLKLDDELVTRALDQEEIGNYNHLLLNAYPELKKEAEASSKKASGLEDDDDGPDEAKPDKVTEPEKPRKRPRFIADFPDESPSSESDPETEAKTETDQKTSDDSGSESVSGMMQGKGTEEAEAVSERRQVNWADMGKKFAGSERKPPIWVIGAVVILLAVLAGLDLISQSWFFTSETTEDDGPVSEQTTEGPAGGSEQLVLDLNEESEPVEQTQPPVLQDTLYLTIYAANERLDPVRVWSDLKPRIDPYWIEQGTALNFEFSDTIRIRGQYARMLLFLNGHLIENFRQEYFNAEENAVELNRSLFQDPEWAVEVPLEVPANVAPPDSVAFRPTF